jgi:hypothetical protein
MARLYADENFPLPVVVALRQWGHDVLTVQEAGQGGQALPDAAVLAFAQTQDRAVLTLNRKHFIHLHAVQPDHAGLVVCTFDLDFVGQADRIHTALTARGPLARQLVRVNRLGPAPSGAA